MTRLSAVAVIAASPAVAASISYSTDSSVVDLCSIAGRGSSVFLGRATDRNGAL